jgi:hypothetical protein
MRSAAVRTSANNTSSSSRLSSAAARRNTGKPHSAEHEQPTPALRGQLVEMAWCGLVVSAAGGVEVQIRHLTIKMVSPGAADRWRGRRDLAPTPLGLEDRHHS